MAAALPLTRADLAARLPDIACTADDPALARVLALPARPAASADLIAALSAALRTRPGPELRQAQAEVLREAWEYRGAFAPMQVGAGKSLPTFLLPTVLHAQRPVLAIPASLFGKTQRDFARYSADWRVRLPHLISYEEMGRDDRHGKLDALQPDLLILDEAHHLRNDSSRTRKFARYIASRRALETDFGSLLRVVALSGTLMSSSLVDYHHIAVWCLGDRAPLPVRTSDAERWSAALDRDLGPLRRIELGGLSTIPGGYHDWFRSRRGVVPTRGSDCNASIRIQPWRPDVPKPILDLIAQVEATSTRPDDVVLSTLELPGCLADLALGFYSRWDPIAPTWWSEPRSDWYAYERDVIALRLDGIDSPMQLRNALDAGRGDLPDADAGRRMLAAWRTVEPHFVPNPVPVWIDDSVLRQAAEYVTRRGAQPAIVWVDPIPVGRRMHELGVPYYGAGNNPETAPGGRSITCSLHAHREGKNLQDRFARSLSLSLPATADWWEQKIGRVHRAGQSADTVLAEYIDAIDYHGDVMTRVLAQARADALASGFDYKLTLADWA
ncbi:MAG: hypothetical protein IPH07_24230 [Deltaproteobacteria bacterium]|nr:hypothetical protein [Deltaproteobacteria bacterium]